MSKIYNLMICLALWGCDYEVNQNRYVRDLAVPFPDAQVSPTTITLAAANFISNTPNPWSYSFSLGLVQTPTDSTAGLTIPVGRTISGIRIFVKDNSVGPTKLKALFVSMTYKNHTVLNCEESNGTGTDQTLTCGSMSILVSPATFYEIEVSAISGAGQSNIYGAEIDIL